MLGAMLARMEEKGSEMFVATSDEAIFDQQEGMKVDPETRVKNKKDFMHWFDSLEYSPPVDERVELEQAAEQYRKEYRAELKQKQKKRLGKRLKLPPEPKYLNYLEKEKKAKEREKRRLEAREEKLRRGQTLSERSRLATSSASCLPKLPRVASVKTKKQLDDERKQAKLRQAERLDQEKKLAMEERRRQARRPGIEFWSTCNACRLLKRHKVGFVPTLIFDLGKGNIRWICFSEASGSFRTVNEFAGSYAKVLQSLCYFQDSPAVNLRRYETGEPLDEKYLVTRNDVVLEIERICKLFSTSRQANDDNPAQKNQAEEKQPESAGERHHIYVLQAVVPATVGTISQVSQGSLVRKIEKHAGVQDLEISILTEKDTQDSKKVNHWVLGVFGFHVDMEQQQKGPPSESEADKSRAQEQQQKKRAIFDLNNAYRWCIGDFCKSEASLEELEQHKYDEKKRVVYKMVLQHRMGVTDVNQLSALLPTHLAKRMYETVKVCSICFDQLVVIEAERVAKEKAQREAAKTERMQKKLERRMAQAAKEAAQVAREKQKQAEARLAQAKKKQEKLEAELQAKYNEELMEWMAVENQTKAEIIKAQQSLERPQALPVTEELPATKPGAPKKKKSSKRKKEKGKQDQQREQTEGGGQTPEKKKESKREREKREKEEREARERIVEFPGLSCATFFGNDSLKLELCQKILQVLRDGKTARVTAPISQNNMSIEECRLVLRSLYLEFRGMCQDQGYFPDVPLQGENAVMLLNPL